MAYLEKPLSRLFTPVGWLNAIREWPEEFVGNMSSREFVDTITRDLLGSRVFVYSHLKERPRLTEEED